MSLELELTMHSAPWAQDGPTPLMCAALARGLDGGRITFIGTCERADGHTGRHYGRERHPDRPPNTDARWRVW